MPPARPLPPQLQGRPFAVAEALRLGVSAGRLRAPDLRVPFSGVRVPVHLPDDLATRARAALLVLPAGTVVSGRAAASLCGLPWRLGAPDVLAEPLAVAVPPGAGDPSRAGIAPVQCRWAEHRHVLRRPHPGAGLPVLHPAHLWCEVAAVLPLVDAVALADAVRRRWARQEEMAAALAVRSGGRDVGLLRRVLALVRHPVDSAMETRLRLLLLDAGLPEPRCGRDLVVEGEWIGRPDLSWPGVRVAVEYEGDHHRSDARQWRRDVRSRERMRAAGWRVLLLTADDVLRHPGMTTALVASALRERGMAW